MLSNNQKKKQLKQMGAKVCEVYHSKCWFYNGYFIDTYGVKIMTDNEFHKLINSNFESLTIPFEVLE